MNKYLMSQSVSQNEALAMWLVQHGCAKSQSAYQAEYAYVVESDADVDYNDGEMSVEDQKLQEKLYNSY